MKTYTAIRRKHWRLCHREQREGVRFVISRSLAYSLFEDKYGYRGQTPLMDSEGYKIDSLMLKDSLNRYIGVRFIFEEIK